eukprot:15445969-Alexandrium_andersonii.AAC.1
MGGPVKKPLRLRVVTGIKIMYDDGYSKEKVLQMQEKGVKRASQEDCDKMAKRLMVGHENIAGENAPSIVQNMLNNMGGVAASAFGAMGMALPDMLGVDQSAEEEDDDNEDEEGDEGEKKAQE